MSVSFHPSPAFRGGAAEVFPRLSFSYIEFGVWLCATAAAGDDDVGSIFFCCFLNAVEVEMVNQLARFFFDAMEAGQLSEESEKC